MAEEERNRDLDRSERCGRRRARHARGVLADGGGGRHLAVAAAVLSIGTSIAAEAAPHGRAARQTELDAVCEAARATVLQAERTSLVSECMEKGFKSDRAACERFYHDHGAATASRPPLHYDLPACVRAFEYRKNHRVQE
jgi:hypothetical protein